MYDSTTDGSVGSPRAKTEKELAVKTMEMEVTTAHQKLIADAYDKGFQRCKDNFKELKELMG